MLLEQLQDIDAERSVLGAALLGATEGVTAVLGSNEGHYTTPAHKTILGAIAGLVAQSSPIDVLTVKAELEKQGKLSLAGGASYLAELEDVCASVTNVEHYAVMLKRLADQRKLLNAFRIAVQQLSRPGAELEKIAAEAVAPLQDIVGSRRGLIPFRDMMGDVLKELQDRHAGLAKVGVKSGLKSLDSVMPAGLQPGQFIVIAGRPGMGKTAFAAKWILSAAEQGCKVAFFSLEMTNTETAMRMLFTSGRVTARMIDEKCMKESDWARLVRATDVLTQSGIMVCQSADSVAEVWALCKAASLKQGLDLIVVDYLQLLHGKAESREREISQISRQLKRMAVELNVPVIALSQLNRKAEERADKRPFLSDLRDSGSIEQDADVVMLLYRDEYYNDKTSKPGIVEVNCAKVRAGRTGVVECGWDSQFTMFKNI